MFIQIKVGMQLDYELAGGSKGCQDESSHPGTDGRPVGPADSKGLSIRDVMRLSRPLVRADTGFDTSWSGHGGLAPVTSTSCHDYFQFSILIRPAPLHVQHQATVPYTNSYSIRGPPWRKTGL